MQYTHTVFSQLLKGLPRYRFERLVQRHQSDFRTRKLRSWDQFIAMIFSQLSGRKSLRDLETSFNSQHNHFYHLGTHPIHRSTLADANNSRSVELYRDVFFDLLQKVNSKTAKEAGEIVHILDASTVKLNQTRFAWALGHGKFSEVKIHTVYDPQEDIPTYFDVTHGFVGEMTMAKKWELVAKATYIFDRAYYDYKWWKQLDDQQCRFVTRLKKNCCKKVLKIQDGQGNILQDQIVLIGNKKHHRVYTKPLREIVIRVAQEKKPLSIVTNDLESDAREIADLYKKRWQIEIFFKWIKQNLKIKTFLGTSENAVKIQILTAMISYLLLRLWQNMASFKGSLHTLARTLQTNLMTRKGIWELFKPPPIRPTSNQLQLNMEEIYA